MERITHTKEVVIGGETIIAEYTELNYSSTGSHRKRKNVWYYIVSLYYSIRRNAREVWWEIRYGLQRMFKGYDYVDVFNLCNKFAERYTAILTDYNRTRSGHPGCIAEDEWEAIINEMLFHLYYMSEDNVHRELCADVPDNWILSVYTTYDVMEKHKDEFFKLFSQHFYSLWD